MLTGHSYPSYPKGQTRSCSSALGRNWRQREILQLSTAPPTEQPVAQQSKAKQSSHHVVPDLWGSSAACGSLAGSLSAPSIPQTRCCPWPNAVTPTSTSTSASTSVRPCGEPSQRFSGAFGCLGDAETCAAEDAAGAQVQNQGAGCRVLDAACGFSSSWIILSSQLTRLPHSGLFPLFIY